MDPLRRACRERGRRARSRAVDVRRARVVVDDVSRGRPGREARRRRPSGAPPPLPHDLRTTGVGWLIAAAAAVIATALIFRNGVRGVAINVIVVDDTIVRWMSNIDLPGIDGVARGVSYAASWWAIQLTILVLDVALIVFRRWRLLVIYLVVSQLAQLVAARLYDVATLPRPFGVPLRGSWGGWSMPSIQMLALAGLCGRRPVHVGARGSAPQPAEVGGGDRRRDRCAGPPPPRRRPAQRDRGRRPHRRQLRGDRLPLLRAERGLPRDVPPWADRAPRRRRRARCRPSARRSRTSSG